MATKTLNLRFDLKEFKKLENAKEEAKITGLVTNWEDFILCKCLKGGTKNDV